MQPEITPELIKKITKTVIAVFIALAALLVVFNSIYFVEEGQYAIIKRFDKVVDVREYSGIGFKIPFLDTSTPLSKKIAFYDVTPSDVITKDKKSMIVDTYVVWKITEPLTFLQTAGNINEIERRLEATIYGSLKTTIGAINQDEIIKSRENNVINVAVLDNSKLSIKAYGVEIVDVQIKKFDLPESNKNAVFTRMISERKQMEATYIAEGNEEANKIMNSTDKEKQIIISEANANAAQIKAEGESEYMRILAAAYNSVERAEFYEFIRSIDALKTTLKGDKTVILSQDSPLVNALLNR